MDVVTDPFAHDVSVSRVGAIVAGFGSHVTGQPRIDTIWLKRYSWHRDEWTITQADFLWLQTDGTWTMSRHAEASHVAVFTLADAIARCRELGLWDDPATPPKEVR